MLKTLRSKFFAVYLFLVLITAIIGIVSTSNVYSLSKRIQSLMTDNYKSINSVSYMLEDLDGQNTAALTYLSISKSKAINDFNSYSSDFYKWYYIEASNITESGEKELVDEIHSSYINYLSSFSEFQNILQQKDTNAAIDFYNKDTYPQYSNLKLLLRKLSSINEKAMFMGKEKVIQASEEAMYIILILSIIFVFGGFAASWISLRKFLTPLYTLKDNMKALKEGELNKHTEILSEDEIGELSKEFNDMTNRLLQFERSTLGKVLAEKNKSLAIVKSISDPILVMDPNYKIVLVNDSFEELFTLKEESILNKYFLEVIRNGELYDYIRDIYNSENEDRNQKIFCLVYNNKTYYYNVLVTKLKEDGNAKYGVVALFQNVTRLKQIEKLKSDFIATVSHEFKTPLTSIIMGTSLIFDETVGGINLQQKKVLGTINEESEKLLGLVDSLLSLTKLEANKSIFKIQPCSLESIIQGSISSFNEQAQDKNITLQYNIMKKTLKVNVDFEKTTWILNNLISNSLKFTPSGGKILITAFSKENKACIAVKDTGMGIPKDYIEKIFDKFVQVKGTEDKGTGLGLSIAKELVEAQGGEIWCESDVDKGSTFTFTLPLYNEN